MNLHNFNYDRPRCADTLPRVPPYQLPFSVPGHVVPGNAHANDMNTPAQNTGSYFGIFGRSKRHSFGALLDNDLPAVHHAGVQNIAPQQQTQTLHRNMQQQFIVGQRVQQLPGVTTRQMLPQHSQFVQPSSGFASQFIGYHPPTIYGRQSSNRANHVCYSLQCPCLNESHQQHRAQGDTSDHSQHSSINTNNMSSQPPLSAYYTDLERFRRPVESPKLSSSRHSLSLHGSSSPVHSSSCITNPSQTTTTMPYYDLSETSSEASTRIASRMSSEHNVTASTDNDTHQLTRPYTICNGVTPIKSKEIYVSKNDKVQGSRTTLIKAIVFSACLIALLTALCVILLVFSQRSSSFSATTSANYMPVLREGALRVVPAPTDLVDRSQVIIVNRRNPNSYQEQAQQLSEILSIVEAYNGTATDAKFPTNLISKDCGADNDNYFGYRSGEPCVAIVMRPNSDFVPVESEEPDILDMECKCENRDVEIKYSPYRGFPRRFFPRSDRASPLLVMLQFGDDLPLKTELRISCALKNAKNVNPRVDRVSFQLMVI